MIDINKEKFENLGTKLRINEEELYHSHLLNYFVRGCLNNLIAEVSEESEKEIIKILDMFFYQEESMRDVSKPYIISENFQSLLNKNLAKFIFDNIELFSENCFLKAKVLDVLWVLKVLEKDNYTAGEESLNYYLQLVDKLIEYGEFSNAANYFYRCFNLMNSLARKSAMRQIFYDKFIGYLNLDVDCNNLCFVTTLWSINLECDLKRDDIINNIILKANNYLNKIEINKLKYKNANDIYFENITEILVKYYRRIKKHEEEKNSLYRCAMYIYKSSKYKYPQIMEMDLKKTIRILRKIKGNPYKKLISKIYLEIKDLQPLIVKQMVEISSEINITKFVEENINKIKNTNFYESIFIMLSSICLPSEKEIREEAKNTDIQLEDFVSISIRDEKGKVLPQRTLNINELERLRIYNLEICDIVLYPMLKIIRERFYWNWDSFMNITTNNPSIPDGYEKIFAKGLDYFFKGDYFEASSILIVQLENMLRYQISLHQPTNYLLNDYQTDNEKIDISGLIDSCKELKIIDDTLHFNLKYYFGTNNMNIRNNLAHGFLDFDPLQSNETILATYMIVLLVCHPFVSLYNNSQKVFIDKE